MQNDRRPKPLRVVGLFLANLLAACVGTAIMDNGLTNQVFHPRTYGGRLIAEDFVSACVAFCLGCLAFYIQKSDTAKWIWLPTIAWFTYGVVRLWLDHRAVRLLTGDHRLVLAGLPWSDTEATKSDFEFWVQFTLPFVRTIFYSLGAFFCARLKREFVIAGLDPTPALSDDDPHADPPRSDVREPFCPATAEDLDRP
jgi:hypothetical protein